MSGNTTSLYSSTSANGTTGSNNFTTLYPAAQGAIVPGTPYGNANVVSLLATSTDGGNTIGNISATGNVTANFFIGDGSQLTNLPLGNYSNANVAAFLPTYGGNVNAITVFGQGLATQGFDYVQMQYSNAVALPVSQYDIGTGSWFYLDPGGGVFQSNTTGTLQTVVQGNDGSVSATGNITGNYFLGNGSQLTGLPATSSNVNVATFLADFGSNTISTSGNITGGYILGNGSQLTGLPATYGNANVVNLMANFGSNSISTTGSVTATDINSNGNIRTLGAQGNIIGANYVQANYFVGDGSLLTNINNANIVGAYSNANVANYLPIFSGNISAGNMSATGNITASYFLGNGSQLTGISGGGTSGDVTITNDGILYFH